MRYVIIGSTLSGNKGAAAMLEASIQSVGERDKKAQFTLFTYLPVAEEQSKNIYKNLKIINGSPLRLGLIINPLAFLYMILPPLRPIIIKSQAIQEIKKADVLLDQGGITFVDGREKFLLYNVASILPAIMLKTKVIKCSQAMGPFEGKINHLVSRLILPKVSVILARGNKTQEYLRTLRLKNVVPAADYAFCLEVTKSEEKKAKKILLDAGLSDRYNKNVICVSPSQVVRKQCEKLGKDYVDQSAKFIKELLADGKKVVLLPHSARKNSEKTHNNDLPVCSIIKKACGQNNNLIYFNDELSAQVQRYIISTMDICLVSRFHAMIACLSVGTPVGVVGWSHKYKEVLKQFDLQEYAIDLRNLSEKTMLSLYQKIQKDKKAIKQKNKKNISKVVQNSSVNTSEIIKVVN